MTDRISVFQSSPATTFTLEADVVETQASYGSHGRWRVRLYLRANNGPGGTTGSYFGGSGYQDGRINGGIVITHGPVAPFLPSGYANGAQRWRDGPVDWWVNANSNGYWSGSLTSLPVQMGLDYGSIEGVYSGSLPLPRIARAPGAPGQPSVSDLTPTSAKFSWAAAARGNANITDYAVYVSTDPSFGSHVFAQWVGNVLSYNLGSILSPGTTYYVRVRARNGDGTGAYSSSRSFTTLPATAPGMSVESSVSGMGATVTLTPPGGTSGVTKYTVQRRIGSGAETSTDTVTSPLVVNGLTPGTVYQWRASAWFGSYQSPWTAWLPVQQANPNTNPGDYFDGSTAARDDLTFHWLGSTNNSASEARGVAPLGWRSVPFGSGSGAVRLQRVSGGRSGAYCARMLVIEDSTAPLHLIGMSNSLPYLAAVEAGALYVGSIYVRPSRPQLLRAQLGLHNGSGAQIDTVDGDLQMVTDTEGWTRLIVAATVPEGVEYAHVRAVEATGTGYSPWLSGEWMDADDAMISLATLYPYFDGSFPDTAEYDYQWLGTEHASPSARYELTPSSVNDPLADPDCPPIPTPPAPPEITDECVDEVGTWRRYWAVIPSAEVAKWVAMIPTITVTTGEFEARQVRIRIYENPDALTPDQFDANNWMTEQIVSYMPANTTLRIDGVEKRTYASVNGAEFISADRLLRGTGGRPPSWPVLQCGVGYLASFDVPLDAPSGNVEIGVELTRRFA